MLLSDASEGRVPFLMRTHDEPLLSEADIAALQALADRLDVDVSGAVTAAGLFAQALTKVLDRVEALEPPQP